MRIDLSPLTDRSRLDFQLKNHYGFMGEILTQASAGMGSSVYILMCAFIAIYAILFVFGPPAATPYLSEFLVALIPLQSSLKGILAMTADMKRKPGDKYTEGGAFGIAVANQEYGLTRSHRKCQTMASILGAL